MGLYSFFAVFLLFLALAQYIVLVSYRQDFFEKLFKNLYFLPFFGAFFYLLFLYEMKFWGYYDKKTPTRDE